MIDKYKTKSLYLKRCADRHRVYPIRVDFTLNDTNPEFRDCTISFDIICHLDYWDIGNYRLRPLKIAGIIDSLLNNSKLSGIGTLNFLGCGQIQLDENLAGYTLLYRAVHMTEGDDSIPPEEE